MTEVLSIPQSGGHEPFGSSLQRSSPRTSFVIQQPPRFTDHPPYYGAETGPLGYGSRLPCSDPSSAESSPTTAPEFSTQTSYSSTPVSSLSLNGNGYEEEDDNYFPSYDSTAYYEDTQLPEPPTSPVGQEAHESTALSGPSLSASALSRSYLYDPNQTTGDDMAVRTEPTRHVDYLSHTWKEEDMWASWRHVVARRNLYSNSRRLENASWRTWAKFKYRLRTVSPETLNWMKDHDVTWLYGPLQSCSTDLLYSNATPPASQISRSNSFGLKKPILKKRSVSEVMLQRSLSSSTLMKQATDALRAQQLGKPSGERPALGERKVSDFISISGSETPLTRPTTHNGSSNLSSTTSGTDTPATKRHIHFNNKVEQCIAINCDNEDHPNHAATFEDEYASSDDDVLTMPPVSKATKAKISRPTTPRNSFSNESKTIAMLPATTLNYRGDTPDPEQQYERARQRMGGSALNACPSQQTLRPKSPSMNIPLDDEDDDLDVNWQPCAKRRDSLFPKGGFHLQHDDDEEDQPESHGLRRTPSGMFMPCDETDEYPRDGLLGKVVDTVNTARDIAAVIWNVGWRG